MRRGLVLFVTVTMLAAGQPAQAAAAVGLTSIAFDSPGKDTGTRKSLNREVIVLRNTGDEHQDLGGWKLRAEGSGRAYKFGSGMTLRAGDTIRLHTGRGKDRVFCDDHCTHDLYWGRRNYIWGNGADIATLINGAGDVVDDCSYDSDDSSPASCLPQGGGGGGEPAPQPERRQMTTFQGNPSHDGVVRDSALTGELELLWTEELGHPISYPVIADGRVFVLRRGQDLNGTVLHALGAPGGESLWERPIGGSTNWAALTYEAGRLFVLNHDGVLLALNASDGATEWTTQLPDQTSFTSAPVADDGVVYTGGSGNDGTLYAVSAQNGEVLWTKPVRGGSQSSPALSDDTVFVSYSCPNVHAFARATGEPRWSHHPDCFGGGGKTAALHAGRLYVRDNTQGYIFDAGDGELLDQFGSVTIPVLFEDTAVYGTDGNLTAVAIPAGTTRWTFDAEEDLTSAPLVVNSRLYVGSETGKVYGLNLNSGAVEWTADVGEPIPYPDEQNVSQPLTGFGASEGRFIVPSATKLNVFAA
jgi:outer membrane protein assembly factor BamB